MSINQLYAIGVKPLETDQGRKWRITFRMKSPIPYIVVNPFDFLTVDHAMDQMLMDMCEHDYYITASAVEFDSESDALLVFVRFR